MTGRPFSARYDVILIGAGHNGLVTAGYLGKAGYRVLVLEAREILGGAATTEEIFPGFRADTGSFDAGGFLPQVVAELSLRKHGLRFVETPVVAFAPQPDGRALTLWREPGKSLAEIEQFSREDAEKFPQFQSQVQRMTEALRRMMTLTPPPLSSYHARDLLPWLRAAVDVRRMGRQGLMDFLRVLPMPVADFLDEWFENPVYKGILGSLGVRGTMAGPRSPGTALLFLYGVQGAAAKQSRSSRFVRGGMLQLAEALARAAHEHGVEIRTGCRISQVCTHAGRATGVLLDNGEEILARVVVSNASPRHTFLDLVGPEQLEVRFVREVNNIRYRGSLARVILALDALPHFRAAASREVLTKEGTLLSGHTVLCPGLDYLERAYDAAKYGQISEHPVLDLSIPTMLDASFAPPGKHLMLINVQYAPYHLAEGDWDVEKGRLGRQVIDLLDEYAPGLQNLVLHQEVLSPVDLERRFGLPEGCIYHGQMALDQLLVMRPVPGYSQYRTPIQGLYLCGAGTHPGGGVTGAPGHNAAREILHDLRLRSHPV